MTGLPILRSRYALPVLIMATVSACAHYTPAPLHTDLIAQTSPLPPALAADDLLRQAIARSPDVAAARQHLLATLAARRAARQQPAFNLTLASEYSKAADAARPWLWGATVDIPVDIGGRRAARVTAADVEVLKARAAVAEALWGVRQRLRQAQSDLSNAHRTLVAAQAVLETRQALEAVLQQRMQAGEDARDGLDAARLGTLTAQQAVLQAKAQMATALSDLAHALDTDTASVAVLAPEASVTVGDFTDADSLYARPDILTAIADYDLSESQLKLAVAQQYPGVTLSPGYTWERGVVKLPFNLGLSLPPFDGNRANIDAAEHARAAAGKTLEATVKSALAGVERTDAQWQSARTLAATIEQNDLPQADATANRAQTALRQGEGDRIVLLQARVAQAETHLALIQAQTGVDQARLALEEARHIPFDPADARDLKAALEEMPK